MTSWIETILGAGAGLAVFLFRRHVSRSILDIFETLLFRSAREPETTGAERWSEAVMGLMGATFFLGFLIQAFVSPPVNSLQDEVEHLDVFTSLFYFLHALGLVMILMHRRLAAFSEELLRRRGRASDVRAVRFSWMAVGGLFVFFSMIVLALWEGLSR